MILDLEAVKQELKVDIDDDDERIVRKMDQAVAIVLDFLKVDSDAYENVDGDNDFPDIVYAGVIGVILAMYDKPDKDPLTPAVRSMLHRLRDPALA
jgi:hypothetical protein